jgi:anaerobic selenocysteine-containing dehydrogenase
LTGFAHPDGKFRFKPDWTNESIVRSPGSPPRYRELSASMPALPEYWPVIEAADEEHPFRLVVAPSRGFLNSSFSETPGSRARERRPEVMLHPDDMADRGFVEGQLLAVGNPRGSVRLTARRCEGLRRGVAIAEGIWPNGAHQGGVGINTLTSAEPAAPFGGAAFHDTHVWIEAA